MDRTNRRRFLTRIGAVGTAVFAAGCSGGGGGGGGEGGGGESGTTTNSPTGTTTSTQTATATTQETTTGMGGDNESMGNESMGNESMGGGSTSSSQTVIAGPDGNLVFEPETVEIPVGGTVTWEFASAGHNVSAKPGVERVSIPENAEPFASYDGDATYEVIQEGATYEHTFETAGEYTYVCVPHISSGMVATVTVTQ